MEERIKKVRELLERLGLDAIFVSTVSNISYLTGYFNFSIEEREAYLLITKKDQFIFTDTRYSEAIEKYVKDFKLITHSPSLPFKNALKQILNEKKISKLGFEEDNLIFKEYRILRNLTKNLFPVTLEDIRVQKTENEIKKIKKACEIGDLIFKKIIKEIKLKISEKEISFKIELFVKEEGADISFKPIVAFGENSSVPHHETGNSRLTRKLGQFILLDFGIKYDGYSSDMSRTLFFGKASEKQKLIYKTVLKSQDLALNYLKEMLKIKRKIKAKEVDKVAREHIKQVGFNSIPHSLGHGVGLKVHEAPRLSPRSKEYLEEGMVFSIEPGIYIPGYGGVRIEDMFAIVNGKLDKLTDSPKLFREI